MPLMGAKINAKGQLTLPKAIREAAGLRPGDAVRVRARSQGGIIIEREREQAPNLKPGEEPDTEAVESARKRLDRAIELLHRRGIKPMFSADELMHLTRDDD